MPRSRASGRSRSFAFRSQSAVSSAEIAVATRPSRPRLRTARCIARQAPGGSIASSARDALREASLAAAARCSDRHTYSRGRAAAALDLDDHQRGRIPTQGAVRLRRVGRNRVGTSPVRSRSALALAGISFGVSGARVKLRHRTRAAPRHAARGRDGQYRNAPARGSFSSCSALNLIARARDVERLERLRRRMRTCVG